MLSISLPVSFEPRPFDFKALTSQKALLLAPRPAVALIEWIQACCGPNRLDPPGPGDPGTAIESPRALVFLPDMCFHVRPVWAGQPCC